MKILVVSNLYPPHYIGGYEIGCQNFVNYLKKNTNNNVMVLTSNYGNPKRKEKNIQRTLITSWSYSYKNRLLVYFKNLYREIQNREKFKKIIKIFEPDKIIFWNMTGISLSMVNIANKKKIPYCIYAFDEQFSRIDEDFYVRQIRKINKSYRPNLENIIFASNFLKKSFFNSVSKSKNKKKFSVINWGVQNQKKRIIIFKKKINILYIGQIVKHKGLDVLLKSIALLDNKILNKINVNIYGAVHDNVFYEDNLEFIKKNKLNKIVFFNKKFARKDLKKIMNNNEILVFPSTWKEPFAISLLEAQSFGLAVIASDTGGSNESLSYGKAGILFKNNNYSQLSNILKKLITKKSLIRNYSFKAQENIRNKYNFFDAAKKIFNKIKTI